MIDYQYQDGIYRPVIDEIFLYIDDGGLKSMDFEGYAAVLLDKYSHDELTQNLMWGYGSGLTIAVSNVNKQV